MNIDQKAVNKQIGRNCAEARKRAGLSQLQLSLRLHLHPNEISRMECGRHCPRLTTLLRLARDLGIPLMDLLQGIE